MKSSKNEITKQQKIFFALILLLFAAVFTATFLNLFTDIFDKPSTAAVLQFVSLIIAMAALAVFLLAIPRILTKLDELSKASQSAERIATLLQKDQDLLSAIDTNTRLTEIVKQIACRDADTQSLRDIVFDKLQHKDFESAFEIIDEIQAKTPYNELAAKLRTQAEQYQSSSSADQINQMVTHIEKLFRTNHWTQASLMIEKLIADHPESERAKQLRHDLLDKKLARKDFLLSRWDQAVKRQDIDGGIEIIKELDSYLTPNEARAFQDKAAEVFKNKLQNMGVRFSLAVSEKEWSNALRTGREIVRNFPNTKMAEEIRTKFDILKDKVREEL